MSRHATHQALRARLSALQRHHRLSHWRDAIKTVETHFSLLARELNALQNAGYQHVDTLISRMHMLRNQWHSREDAISQAVTAHYRMLRIEIQQAESSMALSERQPDSDDLLADAQAEIDDLDTKLTNAERDVEAQLAPYKRLEQIRRQVELIKWSLPHWEATTASKLPNERLIIAADAEWVIHDDDSLDPDGVLFLTDKRLIFEKTEKQERLFGLMSDVTQELQWAVSLEHITAVHAEDTPKDMLYLTLTDDAPHPKITLEIKGKSDNEEWQDYILNAQKERAIIPEADDITTDDTPTTPLDSPSVDEVPVDDADDEEEETPITIIPVINLDDQPEAQPPAPPPPPQTDYDNLIDWVDIPGVDKTVSFTIPGEMREGIPPRTVQKRVQAPAFKIARTPVTNAQWQAFEDDPDGYAQPHWWDFNARGRELRRRHAYLPPISGDDAPRTGINYFDALAFCRWLSAKTGQPVTLPSEEERDHAFASNSALKAPTQADEWTVTATHYPDADPVKSFTSRIAKGKRRQSQAMGARVKDVGFRPVILSSRIIEDYQPTQPLDYYLNKLEKRGAHSIGIPPEAFAIASFRDPDSIPRLLAALQSDQKTRRLTAIKALEYLAPYVEVPAQPILDYIAAEDEEVYGRNIAYWVLVDSGARVVPTLINNLKHPDPITREKALGVLTRFHYRKAIPVEDIHNYLREALQDDSEIVVTLALDWLRLDEDKTQFIDAVKALNSDPRAKVQAMLQQVYDKWGIQRDTPAPQTADPIDPTAQSTPKKVDSALPGSAQQHKLTDVLGTEVYWLHAPAGSTTIERQVMTGYDQYKKKTETIQAQSSIIAQFPVKVEQFQKFIDDPDGYNNKRWWEFSFTAMDDRSAIYKPPTGGDLDPVDQINFWDALAFTHWLNTRTGHQYRLPYEAEWLQAVQHLDLAFPHTEWMVAKQPGYKLTIFGYAGAATALRRGNKPNQTGDPLGMRQELIALGRYPGLSFRLVDTGKPFEPETHTTIDVKQALAHLQAGRIGQLTESAQQLAIAADPETVSPLINLLEERSASRYAAFILSWIADRVPLPIAPLITHLNGSSRVQTYLRQALIQIGADAVEPLKQIANNNDPKLRQSAVGLLTSIAPEEAYAIAIDKLGHDPDDEVRTSAAYALGRIGNADAIPYLEKAIRSNHQRLVKNAKKAIEQIKKSQTD